MITILITWAGLFLVYKAGGFKWILKKFKTGSDNPPERYKEPPEDRRKWENEARYILTKQGQINPDTVHYMGDEMLKNIIREYLDI